ncbi:MAG: YraN family protein [Anaerolineales bacterium]
MNHNQKLGRWGEEAAADYLQKIGYTLIEKNAHASHGEIDLVTRLGDVTVFVEVKTRSSQTFGLPEEAVSPRKLAHMRAAAERYAAEHEIDHWQLDVLAVEGVPGLPPRIEHFENV